MRTFQKGRLTSTRTVLALVIFVRYFPVHFQGRHHRSAVTSDGRQRSLPAVMTAPLAGTGPYSAQAGTGLYSAATGEQDMKQAGLIRCISNHTYQQTCHYGPHEPQLYQIILYPACLAFQTMNRLKDSEKDD